MSNEQLRDLRTIINEVVNSHTHVTNIVFNRETKVLVIHLKSDELLTYEQKKALSEIIVKQVGFIADCAVKVDYTGIKVSEENMKMIFKEFTKKTFSKNPTVKNWIEKAVINYYEDSKKLVVIPENKFAYDNLMNKDLSRITREYFSDSFDVNISMEMIESDAALEPVENEYRKKAAETLTTIAENNSGPREVKAKPVSTNDFGGGNSFGKDKEDKKKGPDVVYRKTIKTPVVKIISVVDEESLVCVEGEVFAIETRELKGGKTLISLAISDKTNSIGVKLFAKPKEKDELLEKLKKGNRYKIEGTVRYDTFERELVIFPNAINHAPALPKRKDLNKEKRVELHVHTNMSAMDGLCPANKLVKRAEEWGHKAIAITDHGVLQSFPDAMHAQNGDFKVIYGVEGYIINDQSKIVDNADDRNLNDIFVVFDLETTGFSSKNDGITEIGAVKIQNGLVIDRYSTLVNPEKGIPSVVVELTGITNDMVKDKRVIKDVMPEFIEFVGDAAVVAHNAVFDMSFISEKCKVLGINFKPTVLDTLSLSRLLLTHLKRHKLKSVAKFFKISMENHHRAVDDAEATATIFVKFVEMLMEKGIYTVEGINTYALKAMDFTQLNSYHVIILVKNYTGLKHLYEITSHAHCDTFYKTPRIPKSLLIEKREGLIIGTACEAGELFKAITNNRPDSEIEELVKFYDYLEIQPTGNNQFMIEKNLVENVEELQNINKRIVKLGEVHNKLVVATGDVHFLDPEDEIYRRILMAGKGFSDADNQPPLYFKTTDEMLKDFEYLGKEKCHEVVIKNTNLIADMIDNILPVPDGTFPPRIEGSDEEFRTMCYAKAKRIYGDPIPEVVIQRLDRELNSIISNGYAVMYIIAQKLVTKSLEDGYLVGSRGSVGSSFAATMSDITEVNPLPPHYICGKCKANEFILDGSIGSGADLPDKLCPDCGEPFIKDGHDIPFEVFLGFDGDKEPDIDLNFAGVYQATSHQYTEELFGKGKVYKAGTIGTIAEKTAFGYVKKYFEEREIKINNKEVLRLSGGCTGVKRTTGQHPGGIMVIPDYKDVHDFCPVQHPANDGSSGVMTTHFDYHSISGRLLKLDILGHDVPTIIKHLEQITDVDVLAIPLDDKETVKIFTSTESLKILDPDYKIEIGSLGIPEFGTKFVRQMLKETQPTTFAELVRISGLSHGTDVWINNAQDLVRDGVAELKDVISTRDDIMNYLIYNGLPPIEAFTIMERVRKGKGLTDENIILMRENKIPEWYITSCNTIKYMFPKAHAVAYVMMSFRIAYFKVHYPLAFYATYFTIKVDDFDADLFIKSNEAAREYTREIDKRETPVTKKEMDVYTIAESVDEMFSRGLKLHRVDLYKSDSDKFIVLEDGLLPPLRSLQGVGENAAKNIVMMRHDGEILSIEDLRKRAKVTKTAIEVLKSHGCLEGLPESNQLSLFAFE